MSSQPHALLLPPQCIVALQAKLLYSSSTPTPLLAYCPARSEDLSVEHLCTLAAAVARLAGDRVGLSPALGLVQHFQASGGPRTPPVAATRAARRAAHACIGLPAGAA